MDNDTATAKVKLGQTEITLRRPASLTERREIVVASVGNQPRALAAALGRCWAHPAKHAPKVKSYDSDGSALRYGRDVLDDLLSRGMDYAEVLAAGVVAFNLCADGVFSESEVKAAEDFSAAPAPSTST